MVRSPSFGSNTYDYSLFEGERAINPRFHYGSVAFAHLTLPYTLTRWIVLQKARRHPAPLVLKFKTVLVVSLVLF